MNMHYTTPGFPVGSTRHLLGTLITLRAAAGDTGGAFTLVEIAVAPGQGTPAHQHEDAESFYVTNGEITFVLEGSAVTRRAGSFVHIPSGVPHSFRNASDQPAHMLGINMPGGPHMQFFAEAGEQVDDALVFPPMSPPDIPKLVATAQRHGITILPPG